MDELTPAQVHQLLAEQVNEKIEAMEEVMLEHEQVEMPVEDRGLSRTLH